MGEPMLANRTTNTRVIGGETGEVKLDFMGGFVP